MGLPYFFYWDIGEIDFYRKVVEFALPQGFYHSCHVSFYPYVIPRTVFPPLRQTITEHLGKPDFNAAFKEIAIKLQTFSEFNLLGNYMLTMQKQGKNEYNSPVPCPFFGYVMAEDGKKFVKCRNHAFPALHIPYPYSPNMNNLPGNATSRERSENSMNDDGYLGKFKTATERYMVEVSRAFNHGYCLAQKYKNKLNHFDKFSPLFAISNQELCSPESSRFSNQSFAYQEGLIPGFKRDFDLMEKRIFRLDSQRSGRCDVPV
ncbi:hypothetical protein BKA69DRAFT_205257 [Paraphysoderma sedebokerense]|nr:hypothetical protein BKA69DRAFT_205257 [Paraphysoderma sedebokerense]